MMYMIYFGKIQQRTQTVVIEIEDDEEQQAIDAVAAYIRDQHKSEVATPVEEPLVMKD